MRFNKNFANVYTPYHEFEYTVVDLEEKKRKRMDRKRVVGLAEEAAALQREQEEE